MWAVDEANGPFPVSVPQSVWAWASKQELCDFMQMIEAEHRQCLEEDPLENETAGEPPPPVGRGVLQTPKEPHFSPCEPRSTSHSLHSVGGGSTMGLLGGEERMLGKAGEPDKEGRHQQTSMFPSPTPSLGSSQLFPKESIQIGVQKSECSQLCIRRSLPLFSRKSGVMSSWLPSALPPLRLTIT